MGSFKGQLLELYVWMFQPLITSWSSLDEYLRKGLGQVNGRFRAGMDWIPELL